MPRVPGPIAASTPLATSVQVTGSTSTNRTVAPVDRIAPTVAAEASGLVTTSSPGPQPASSPAMRRAAEPLDTATT